MSLWKICHLYLLRYLDLISRLYCSRLYCSRLRFSISSRQDGLHSDVARSLHTNSKAKSLSKEEIIFFDIIIEAISKDPGSRSELRLYLLYLSFEYIVSGSELSAFCICEELSLHEEGDSFDGDSIEYISIDDISCGSISYLTEIFHLSCRVFVDVDTVKADTGIWRDISDETSEEIKCLERKILKYFLSEMVGEILECFGSTSFCSISHTREYCCLVFHHRFQTGTKEFLIWFLHAVGYRFTDIDNGVF